MAYGGTPPEPRHDRGVCEHGPHETQSHVERKAGTVCSRYARALLAPVLECVETQVYLLGRPFVSVYADYAAFLVPVVVSLIVHVHARLQIRRHG